MAEVGQKFRLKAHHGYNPHYRPEETQDYHAPLFAGQIGEVIAHIPRGVSGGSTLHDTTILKFQHHMLGNHTDVAASQKAGHHVGLEEPPHTETEHIRHVGFTDEQLADMFEEVD